jgi:2-amino-4-hydroxy-6-hydroxymethyldihydropteridine diphosphokinase
MSRVAIAFGSNVEPRADYHARALAAVASFPGTRLVAASELEETEPVGVPDEFSHLKFLNRVAIFETSLSPEEFSQAMHRIEDELGRVRGEVRNIPRTIDIDMIDYEGVVSSDPELILPHPRAKERDFVMAPLKRLGIGF